MIYTGIGDNLAEIQYREDPLAKEIKPDYNKLSMSAWGMPQLNDLEQFNPKIEDNLDSDSDSLRTYVETMSKLKDQAKEFFKLGVDITKPSLDPDINDAHLEFNKKYNDALVLAKQSQYSRKLKEDITKNQNKDIYTNPVPYGLITSMDKYIERPDLAGIKAFVDSRKGSRDLAYRNSDYETAKQEIQTGLDAIDQWEQQAIARKPEFASQYKADAELQRAAIKLPFFDQYKHDNLDFKKKKQAEDLGFKYATLNTKGQQLESDFPEIVTDLLAGGSQQKGALLNGVSVGKTFVNVPGKNEPIEVDDVITNTYPAVGSTVKQQHPNLKATNSFGKETEVDDNAQYVVVNKTSGLQLIKVKDKNGNPDIYGIQKLMSYQAPYDKKQVTPTTDFNFTPNGILVDKNKSNKTFSKPNTSSGKTTISVKEKKSTGIDLNQFLKK